ncbi:hypothetical protein [Candidatus Vidania fulgoroideorum]
MNLYNYINFTTSPVNLKINGSKSISNRNIICSLMCKKCTYIKNCSNSEDSKIIFNYFRIFKKDNSLIFYTKKKKKKVFLKNAGTVLRPMLVYFTFSNSKILIDGNVSMRKRPIYELLNILKKLGAEYKFLKSNFCLPIKIFPSKIKKKKKLTLNCSKTSQFATSLFLVLPRFIRNKLKIYLKNIITKYYILITFKVLILYGVKINIKNNSIVIEPHKYEQKKKSYIEPDISSLSYFVFFSLINRNIFFCKDISSRSIQGELKILNVFKKIGINLIFSKYGIFFFYKKIYIKNLTVNCKDIPDSSLILTILVNFFIKRVKLINIKNWNFKESNRIYSIFKETIKSGNLSIAGKNWILFKKKSKRDFFLKTYLDHRICMTFSFISYIKNLKILFPRCVKKTFCNFYENLNFNSH